MDSDAEGRASDEDTSDTSSSTSSVSNFLISGGGVAGDAEVTLRGGLVRTVGELDSELAAVQKMVRRERARKQRETAQYRSASSLQLSAQPLPPSLPNQSIYATVGGRRRAAMPAPPVDKRSRTPSMVRTQRLKEKEAEVPATDAAVRSSSVMDAALSSFMRDAEAEFDERL